MDSITHIALGAIVGEALLGKKLGKKAMLIGAAAQSLPDIDFVTSFWLSPVEDLLSHRGFTHSILFAILASFLLGFAAVKLIRASGMTAKEWILFFGLEIAIHLALDSLNCYGTGLFEPFSHTRISFNVLYVADPFYSLWLGVGFSALLILKRHSPSRKNWTRLSLLLSTSKSC